MIKRVFLLFLLPFATLVFSQGLPGAPSFGTGDFNPRTDITVKVISAPGTVRTNEEFQLKLLVSVPDGYHITKELFSVESVKNDFTVVKTVLPEGKKNIIGEVLSGEIPVSLTIIANREMKNIPFKVTYQACSDGENAMCFPPVTVQKELKINVNSGKLTLEQRLSNALNSSMLLALLIIFLGGIGASLTPCVYPVIPLTVAFIGARSDDKKLKGFILSIFLVLGIATTYSVLGVLSAESHMAFGSIAQKPGFIIPISLIFIAMGLSMFGYYEIQLPSKFNSKLQVKRKGLLGAYLVGMATGVLAAPCVGPIVVVLLTWIAKTGSPFLGFLYMFVFALGMGMLFILIGTFTGLLSALPKSGNWMLWVKGIFGIVFIGVALWFLKPLLQSSVLYIIAALGLLPFLFMLFRKKWVNGKTGIAFLVIFLIAFIAGTQLRTKTIPEYQKQISNGFSAAVTGNRLVVLDFYADWCAACKELDETTWSNKEVKKVLTAEGVMIKLDFTQTSKSGSELQQKYGVRGLPTVIILNKNGKELKRFSGFLKPSPFLKLFNEAKKDAGIN
ncbi:MAG: thioredoxin fold domain-containing protein [Acidobacteria bacterium]|nr:thioredoxin fold domain-containing protein [Acidobacteriota bacterium]